MSEEATAVQQEEDKGRAPEVGEAVEVVTEDHRVCDALVTAVWGTDGTACINVVFVSGNVSASDQYGRQLERYASCQSEYWASKMTNPGRFWRFKASK